MKKVAKNTVRGNSFDNTVTVASDKRTPSICVYANTLGKA